ncbi:EscU/YscU/HrcU family type III secretion system export apparatus switch protein [Sandaracinobacteroides hominis]|uniref:EscU/YscU/HrcU family type III secretion system export apparatus switch protein n=1 Tax=Sandaracinobacteroides hominis TaxID=2780086 RepID=UPI0018F662D5|nr:flagellar type III secretion system protein FlhB [Sandaracinobacteroides hominis]
MAENAGEKTEAPTQRRREQAREKGDRLASRELATAMAGIAGALWLSRYGADLAEGLKAMLAGSLQFDHADLVSFDPVRAIWKLFLPLGTALGALAAMAAAAAILGQAVTGGLSFNLSLLAPKPEKLSPAKGLARMFGPQGFVELLKSLAKAAVILGLAGWLLVSAIPLLAGLSAMPLQAAMRLVGAESVSLILWLTGGLALIAAIDLPIQLRRFLQRLRMTKQEVKDEFKQQEGSAEVKHAIRRMARDSLKRASRTAMADATVVLTNPTHFAVALRYRPELDAAPVIVARGRGIVAEVIRELAAERQVPVLSYPSVARAVYFTGRVGGVIRADLYAAVATILAFVLRVGGPQGEQPEAEAPAGAQFDENGKQVT